MVSTMWEPYFGRVRFFNKPKNGASHNKMQVWIPAAVKLTLYMKYALCLKTHIEDNNLDDKVKLLLSHDQQVSECEKITLHSGQSHKQS
jgi:hypothetical protein